MINDYGKFVNTTTSNESKFTGDFINRLMILQQNHKDVQWSRLMTSAIGMLAESGEFTEIMKKIFFQGKEMTEDNLEISISLFLWSLSLRTPNIGFYASKSIDWCQNPKKLTALALVGSICFKT